MYSIRRRCLVLDENTGEEFTGYFERYGDSIIHDLDSNRMLKYTVAIVEKENGKLVKVDPNSINFIEEDDSNYKNIKDSINNNFNLLEKLQNTQMEFNGIPTGFSKIDEITSGLQPSELIVIASRPGMGKTAFALNIAANVAVDSNIPVAIFSLEMTCDQVSMRLLASDARINSSRLKKSYFLNDSDWCRLTDSAETLSKAPIFIDDSNDLNLRNIIAKARRLKKKDNIGLIIIDYIQLIRSNGDRRDLELAEISRSLKMLAKELQIPIILLSQLNRKLEDRNNKRPMLFDLRESGTLEDDADIVAFIYRDEVYNKDDENKSNAEIIFAKHRNGEVGTIHLTFLGVFTRFEDGVFGDYPDI